jgi:hypothetical protein
VTVNSVALTALLNINLTQYAMTNDCGPFPRTLAVNAFCTISVTFKPTSTGLKLAPTISVGVPNGTQINNLGVFILTGTGVTAFNWTNGGTVGVWGNNAGARTITFTNYAATTMTLGASPAVVAGAQFAKGTSTCTVGLALASGQSCTVSVTRTRPGAAPRNGSGTLTINGTGGAAPAQVLNLSGT